jgi:hypothetical protein
MDDLNQYTEMRKQLAAVEKQRRSTIEQNNEQAAEQKRRAQQLREKNQRAMEDAMCGSNIAYRQMREMQAEKRRQEKLEEVMTEREKRTTEESVSVDGSISACTYGAALTLNQIDAYLAMAREGAHLKKLSDNKTGASHSTSTPLAGLSSFTSTPTVSLESGARRLAERRKMYTQVSVSKPAAGPASTRSEDRPITIPRIIPARSPPAYSTGIVDTASADNVAMDAEYDFSRFDQTRLRQANLTRPRPHDFESLMNGGLESEIDYFAAPAPSPSATSKPAVIATTTEPARKSILGSVNTKPDRHFSAAHPFVTIPDRQLSAAHQSSVSMPDREFSAARQPFVDSTTLDPLRKTSPSSYYFVKALTIEPTDKASTSLVDAASAKKEALRVYKRHEQARYRNGGPRGAPGSDFQSFVHGVRGAELDKPRARTIYSPTTTIDAIIINQVNSPEVSLAKERSRRLRQAVTNGDEFEIVGHGELDDEFDLVDSQVPSAVNGKSHSDPNAVIDGLDGAFRAGWDDDE